MADQIFLTVNGSSKFNYYFKIEIKLNNELISDRQVRGVIEQIINTPIIYILHSFFRIFEKFHDSGIL